MSCHPAVRWVADFGPYLRIAEPNRTPTLDLRAGPPEDLVLRERVIDMLPVAHHAWGTMRVGIDHETGEIYAAPDSYRRRGRWGEWEAPLTPYPFKREMYLLALGACALFTSDS